MWLGFGALLPVLPIYFTGAAWTCRPSASSSPPGRRRGWWASPSSAGSRTTARVPLMVIGLWPPGCSARCPLVVSGLLAFVVMRALAGLAAAIYDPAARGYLMDANPPDRRGEAFGLYGAAQMAGFLLGPAIGGVRRRESSAASGFVFVFSGVARCPGGGLRLGLRARARATSGAILAPWPGCRPSFSASGAVVRADSRRRGCHKG